MENNSHKKKKMGGIQKRKREGKGLAALPHPFNGRKGGGGGGGEGEETEP